MKLCNIINNSCFSIISTITGEDSLSKTFGFLQSNLNLINSFNCVYVALNHTEGCPSWFVDECITLYEEYVPYVVVDKFPDNAGHMFGTIDLDESCLQFCKSQGLRYLWKSTDDVLVSLEVLNKEVPEDSEFMYLPGFSYETLLNAWSTQKLMDGYEEKFFAPQSNFFIVDASKVDTLYGPAEEIHSMKKSYEDLKEKDSSVKPWDLRFSDGTKFACEDMLGRNVKELKRQNLLSPTSFRNLIDFVKYNRVGDPSHKNVMLKEIGVCHFHFHDQNVNEVL